MLKLITIAALTSSTEALFGFGKKIAKSEQIDHNSTQIVIEEGDEEIGELKYHPANVELYDDEEFDVEEDDDEEEGEFDEAYQHKVDELIDNKEDFNLYWDEFVEIYEDSDDEDDEEIENSNPSNPPARLVLDGAFKKDLHEQALDLNEDFLVNAQFQFAEYIGLSMIQLIFDKNLESANFIEIFKSDDSYQPALDAKLVATQKIVEEKVGFFAQIHSEYQTAMVE
jgi:hypothetical protein